MSSFGSVVRLKSSWAGPDISIERGAKYWKEVLRT